MNRTELKEIIMEMLNELSPETLTRYFDKTGAGHGSKDGDIQQLNKQAVDQFAKGDTASGKKTLTKVEKRFKGARNASRSIEKQRDDRAAAAATATNAARNVMQPRQLTNKQKKTAWQQQSGQQKIDKRNTQFAAQGSTARVPQDPKSQLQVGRSLSQPQLANPRQDIMKTRSAELGPSRSSNEQDPVPQDVRAKVTLGGKVVFGRYLDSAGNDLGRLEQGKWVPADPNKPRKLKENNTGIIRLTDLLSENMLERRVNLVKVQTVMEKLYPELTETQSKKLMELCTEAHMMAAQLNTTRYIRTENSVVEWKLLTTLMEAKLQELKAEVIKVCEQKNINPSTVVKAIDDVFIY